jgi:hypothetical protein
MSMTKKHVVLIAVGAVVVIALSAWLIVAAKNRRPAEDGVEDTGITSKIEKATLVKMPYTVGSEKWRDWYANLSEKEKLELLAKIIEAGYPGAPDADDFKRASVTDGPGTGKGDYYPIKFLRNYRPLLQTDMGAATIGVHISVTRKNGCILTHVQAAHGKCAFEVDWTNGQVIPAEVDNSPMPMPRPEIIPDGTLLFGGNNKLNIKMREDLGIKIIPWESGNSGSFRARTLVIDETRNIGFAKVTELIDNGMRQTLRSILCVDMKGHKILGDIQMPSGAITWVNYDPANNVLLLRDYDWYWIAMIDLSKPNGPAVPASVPAKDTNDKKPGVAGQSMN